MDNFNQERKEIKGDALNWYAYLQYSIIILAVIALGLLAVNQALGYYYKAHFLKSPCDLCQQLNPEVRECIYPKLNSYPDGMGGWTPVNVNRTLYTFNASLQ